LGKRFEASPFREVLTGPYARPDALSDSVVLGLRLHLSSVGAGGKAEEAQQEQVGQPPRMRAGGNNRLRYLLARMAHFPNFRTMPRGRPKQETTRGNYLDIRLGLSEKQGLRNASEVAGLPLSAWVRTRLRQAAARELQEAGRLIPFLKSP
jgi:hypothetical protein